MFAPFASSKNLATAPAASQLPMACKDRHEGCYRPHDPGVDRVFFAILKSRLAPSMETIDGWLLVARTNGFAGLCDAEAGFVPGSGHDKHMTEAAWQQQSC